MTATYTVGWICALPSEMAAARAMLDEDRGPPHEQDISDRNSYRLGRIGEHDVVIACLPAGVYGTTSAASVAVQMLSSFPSIRIGLLVGIGGGVPSEGVDIRLGDVVVSKPGMQSGGVIQYDMGKNLAGNWIQTGSLNKPPQALLTAVASLEADHLMGENRIAEFLQEAAKKHPRMQQEFCCSPGVEHDQLFEADYLHPAENKTCASCDPRRLKDRPPRIPDGPQIHYGQIASANQVMKDGVTRDKLGRELGVICFEMEAAGLMDTFPCLVIRGICDYADSHKNKRWQKYAAMTAAACAKELLLDGIPRGRVADKSAEKQALETGQWEKSVVSPSSSPPRFDINQGRSIFSGTNYATSGRVNQIGNIASGSGNVMLN
ncbi:hypothetical protein VTN77DRAFT_1115 [Rasamsonia byssochlamydoides]|uniref:uncharacterized protein n=1 Tax=Rasamsonia byssochlamydoides TaxID=89139 RepID=UPI003741EE03